MAVTAHESGLAGGSLGADEEMDLALLDQHLLKTNHLSKRMTSILSQLDTRLSRLDKSIAPLGIRELTRQATNIDLAIAQMTGAPLPKAPSANGHTSHGPSNTASHHSGMSGSSHGHGSSSSRPPPSQAFREPVVRQQETKKEEQAANLPSVMDRKRAVPRTDVIPRWQESPPKQLATPLPQQAPRSASPPPVSQVSQTSQASSPTAPWSPTDAGGERTFLARGPDIMSTGEYFGAMEVIIGDLENLYQGLAEGRGGTREQGVAELSSVLEDAFGQCVQMLLKVVRETIPRPFDPSVMAGSDVPSPSTYYPPLSSVRFLATRLVTVVYPDHPTPKATQVLAPILKDCVADVASVRGDWIRRSLTSVSSHVEEETRGEEKVRLIMKLWESYVVVAEAESALANTMFPGPTSQQLVASTLPYGLSVLNQTINQVVTAIKRNLTKETMCLLDLYAALASFQPTYESTMERVLGTAPHDVQTALQTLRGLALRSFPERLVDIRTPERNATANVAIADVTHSTLEYLEALPSYGTLVEGLLRSSGHIERSWLMGASTPPSTARSAAEEGGLVNLYAADVLGTLLNHLETTAKMMRRPLSSTFLLNNLSHIRNTTSSFNADIIGPGAEDMLNRHFRDAKQGYIGEWTALTALLQHTAQSRFNVGSSHDKQSTKEAAASFFERLAELEHTCRQYPLSRADPHLRDRVGSETEEMVRAAYGAFWNKAHGRGFDKYLQGSPDEIVRRVHAVFR